nr:hypothetical protein [Tanacetum cinerariifolium]
MLSFALIESTQTPQCRNPNETTSRFKRIYVCIGALKRGFKEGLRDLLGLDGCYIKGQYHGQLLTAIGIDESHGIYPLAYAIVETENTSFWSWVSFMQLHKFFLMLSIAATNVPYFDKQMGKLKNIDEGSYEYLQKIPPQHWSRSHFSGRAHCDVLLKLCEKSLIDNCWMAEMF